MKDGELDMWDKAYNFVSYRSIYWNASDEFDELKTESEFSKWKEQYHDILYMDDDIVTPRIPIYLYQLFSNRAGEFFVANNYYKIIDKKLITIIGGDKSKLEKAKHLEKTSVKDGIIITAIPNAQIIETRDSEPGCFSDGTGAKGSIEKDGDRRATIEIRTFLFPEGYLYNTNVTLRVFGYKKR